MTLPQIVITSCFAAIALKALTVGSDFSFLYWFKYGRKYTDWYSSREDYGSFRARQFRESLKIPTSASCSKESGDCDD